MYKVRTGGDRIRFGDCVKLKTGSPRMLVVDVFPNARSIAVEWRDRDGTIHIQHLLPSQVYRIA